jgi:hypothetical protein
VYPKYFSSRSPNNDIRLTSSVLLSGIASIPIFYLVGKYLPSLIILFLSFHRENSEESDFKSDSKLASQKYNYVAKIGDYHIIVALSGID